MKENSLRDYLSSGRSSAPPAKGSAPVRKETVPFGVLLLRSGQLGFCDPAFVPSGVTVSCKPGKYQLEAECLDYGGDRRAARLRVRLEGVQPVRGKALGEFSVDMAMASVFDFDSINDWSDEQEEEYDEWLEEEVVMCDWQRAGTIDCPGAAATIYYCEAGFGDGTYTVYELIEDGQVVGAEVVFLEGSEPYPFEE